MIRLQFDKIIWLFNSQNVVESTGYPLDYRGMLVGSNMYPDLVAATGGYRWYECRFADMMISEVQSIHPSLHQGIVRLTADVILGDI